MESDWDCEGMSKWRYLYQPSGGQDRGLNHCGRTREEEKITSIRKSRENAEMTH